jgi:hypothetical protein
MQELRLVAVSEDGLYAVLEVPGRSGRFVLPIDDRLRIVARGQFSRLAQYEIEVENPLRPKEIQDRIRAGETAEEIADVAGIPIERVRRFEGPVLAERAYRAQEAQAATVRRAGDSGPGLRLGEVVAERMRDLGASPDEADWDSRKRPDGTWLVQLIFSVDGRQQIAEWAFDPQRRHVSPLDDPAARLCLPEEDLPQPVPPPRGAATTTATVTPIATRLSPPSADTGSRVPPEPATQPAVARPAGREARRTAAREAHPAAREAQHAAREARPAAAAREDSPAPEPQPAQAAPPQRARPARKAAGGRSRRSSVPSWDEIMFGTSRQPE